MATRAGLIRVGGRTERTRNAVLNAARDMLERGETDLSAGRLSEASGVHKTTIYRRWPTRELLLRELLSDRSQGLMVKPSDDWEKYLLELAQELNDHLSSPGEIALLRTLLHADASYAAEVRTIWMPLAESMVRPLVAAQYRGEIAQHVELTDIIRTIIGFITSEVLFTRIKPTKQAVGNVVRYLADGIRQK